MADRKDEHREPKDLGGESPAGEEAKRQGMSGDRGAEEAQVEGTRKQPAQTSGRRGARHEQEPEARKSFAPGKAPSEQGDGEPSPERIRDRQRAQGIGRQSGSHSAHGERTQEEAVEGAPAEGHTRSGRQKVPGQPERPTDDFEKDDTVPG